MWIHLLSLGLIDGAGGGVAAEAQGYSGEVNLQPKWYVRRGKKLHIFANAQDADAYLEAEAAAQAAVEKAQKTSRLARKRLKQKVFKPDALPLQTIDTDWLASLVQLFAIPVNLPDLLAKQDYDGFMDIVSLAMERQQDEDEIEMLLLM